MLQFYRTTNCAGLWGGRAVSANPRCEVCAPAAVAVAVGAVRLS